MVGEWGDGATHSCIKKKKKKNIIVNFVTSLVSHIFIKKKKSVIHLKLSINFMGVKS